MKHMSWTIVEEIAVSSLFPWPYAWRGWVKGIGKYIGKAFSEGVTHSENGVARHIYHEEEAAELAKMAIEKARDPEWVKRIERDTYKAMRDAAEFAEKKINNADLTKKTNAELGEIYQAANHHIEQLYSVGLVPSTMDMGHNLFSQMLLDYVEKRGKEVGLTKEEIGEAFATLTTVDKKTLQQEQEEDFLKLVLTAGKNAQWKNTLLNDKWKENAELANVVTKHADKYGWLSRGYEGPVTWTAEYFVELLKSELKQGENTGEKLAENKSTRRKLLEKQKQYEAKLSLSMEFQHFFKVAREFTIVKNERKDVVLKLYHDLDKLMREIARRLNITYKQSMYILPTEMNALLEKGEANASELNQRQKMSYLHVTADNMSVFTGKKAREFINALKTNETNITELNGHCACPGKASGMVKIINAASDIGKMNEGDILISHATDPNLVPAMKKAAAIVTDQGGITSHAAIVSRELKKPCLIGTKIATKVFKDGDLVEVDAANGIIRKIN